LREGAARAVRLVRARHRSVSKKSLVRSFGGRSLAIRRAGDFALFDANSLNYTNGLRLKADVWMAIREWR